MPAEFIYGASVQTESLLFLFSVLAGILGTLVGLGGGIILIPTLVLFFHVPMQYAIATSIVCVIATSSAGTVRYLKEEIAHVRLAIVLETATVFGAFFAAWIVPHVTTAYLEILFTILLIYSALSVLFSRSDAERKKFPPPTTIEKVLNLDSAYFDVKTQKKIFYPVRGIFTSWLMMLGAGVISGLLGVGSGSLKVPVMDQILRLPIKVSTATSNFMMGVTAAASAGIYYMRGEVLPFLAAPAILGIFLGSWLGSLFLNKLPNQTIRRLLVFVLILTAIRMGWKAVGY